MKVSKKTITKWIDALRSGEYKQTTGELQDDNGFCCLGVACKEFIPKEKLDLQCNNNLYGQLPNDQYNAPDWLRYINYDFQNLTGIALTTLNDNDSTDTNPDIVTKIGPKQYTFDEIADLLQAVYVEEVLKEKVG